MTPTPVDETGRRILLGDPLGAGGEGEVRPLIDRPGEVAKLFFARSRTLEKHDKVRAMVAHPPPGAHEPVQGYPVLAWPRQLLFDGRRGRRRFLGYTMQRVDLERDFVSLYQVATGTRRAALGAPLSWDKLVLLGLRITHVVRTLHHMRYAVGDLNDRNILVSRRLTPLFLDTDSFQVPRGILGHYPCRVGDRLYWPPELLGVDLHRSRVDRESSDRYALATLLFQLFLDGMRPYQSRGRRVVALESLEAKTRAGHYPWTRPVRGQLEPPRAAPRYASIPAPIRHAFEDAFVAGHDHPRKRPSAAHWQRILQRVHDAGYRACARRSSHVFGAAERNCPWCLDPRDPFRAEAPAHRGPVPPRKVLSGPRRAPGGPLPGTLRPPSMA